MRRSNKLMGTYFCGNEASDYAKEHGFLDYATLAKSFDAVLNNGIMQATSDIGYWDIENGSEEYYEDSNGNRYTYDRWKRVLLGKISIGGKHHVKTCQFFTVRTFA